MCTARGIERYPGEWERASLAVRIRGKPLVVDTIEANSVSNSFIVSFKQKKKRFYYKFTLFFDLFLKSKKL